MRDRDLSISITSGGRTFRNDGRSPNGPCSRSISCVTGRLSGLVAGSSHQWTVFDPATLRNAPVIVKVGDQEIVRGGVVPIPAFRVEMEFSGLKTIAWITDTGEILREESPLGFIIVREAPDQARALAVSGRMRKDLLEAAAVVPRQSTWKTPPLPPIDDPRNVARIRMRVEGVDLTSPDMQGVGQRVSGDIVEIVDAQKIEAGPRGIRSRSVPVNPAAHRERQS